MTSPFNLRIPPHKHKTVTNKAITTMETENDNDYDKDTVSSSVMSMTPRDESEWTPAPSTGRTMSSVTICETEEDDFEIVSFKSALSVAVENIHDTNSFSLDSLSNKGSPAEDESGNSKGRHNKESYYYRGKKPSQSFSIDQNMISRTPCNSPTLPEYQSSSAKSRAITHIDWTKRNFQVDASLTPQFTHNFYQKLAENELNRMNTSNTSHSDKNNI